MLGGRGICRRGLISRRLVRRAVASAGGRILPAAATEQAPITISPHPVMNRAIYGLQPKTFSRNLASKTFAFKTHADKGQMDAGTVIILDERLQCQFSLRFKLRKCTGQEDRAILPRRTSRSHQEHNVLAALQARLDAGEFFLAVDWLLVYFQNDVAATQVDVFGERTGSTSCTITPFPVGMSRRSAISGVTFADGETEFARLGSTSSPLS